MGVILFHRLQKSKTLIQSAAHRAEAAAEQAKLRGDELEREILQRQIAEQDLRRARDQLADHAAQLDRRVRERTAHLHQALSSLESVLYHIAHDLRGPLRTMEGFSTMLVQNYASRLDAVGKDYANRISDAACRMDQLLRGLLEYGHVCHLEIIPRSVPLDHAVQAVLSQFSGRIETSGAVIHAASPLADVWADDRLIHTVLANIISNALKFVPSGRKPHIRIWTETTNLTTHSVPKLPVPSVRLHIQDNGIGILPEHQERIFGIFQRLRQDNCDQSTGIGLAIVQKAVDRMHGFVGVTSTPGQGSTFWFELPAPSDLDYQGDDDLGLIRMKRRNSITHPQLTPKGLYYGRELHSDRRGQ